MVVPYLEILSYILSKNTGGEPWYTADANCIKDSDLSPSEYSNNNVYTSPINNKININPEQPKKRWKQG
jgi:hypothetical protein